MTMMMMKEAATATATANTNNNTYYEFRQVAMLPQKGDNAAVAKDLLPANMHILLREELRVPQTPQPQQTLNNNNNNNKGNNNTTDDAVIVVITLSAPCLEGHRFALYRLQSGDALLSWGLPFGHACREIRPGDVLLNQKTADALKERLYGPHGVAEKQAIRELLQTQMVNFVDLDVSPDSPFVLETEGFSAVGRNQQQQQHRTTTPPTTKDNNETASASEVAAASEVATNESHLQDDDETTTTTTFLGYPRPWGGVVGTRNHVLVVGLTASSMALLAPLKTRWRNKYESPPPQQQQQQQQRKHHHNNFDGVRIVAHTEGEANNNHNSSSSQQHNVHKLHRCLAGWICHPNVGAVVAVTTGRERHVTRETLLQFVQEQEQQQHRCSSSSSFSYYPTECFQEPHLTFVQLSVSSNYNNNDSLFEPLDRAVDAAVRYATTEATTTRQPCPLSELCIALQCGGSDAFSGLTGNPLAGAVAARFIQHHGGRAILAESPELVGAEPYILRRVADATVAKQFVATTEAYKAFGARHGLSVAGNPSGGNLYRGLSNIVLKSLGAARKKPPDIALDCVLEYGEPMYHSSSSSSNSSSDDNGPKYAFMDSPGNDLESIAGQVASGCNLIIFITGNGAMTNFPFVPTIKVVTTEKRFQLLKHDMDVNAEPYGHGGLEAEKAVNDMFHLCVRVSSGLEKSKGEAKGHSQVSVWRNWAVGEENDNKDQADWDRSGCLPGDGIVASRPSRKNNNFSSSGRSSNQLQLCSQLEPHKVRPDPPTLHSVELLEAKIVERVRYDDCSNNQNILRPWMTGATFSLIPTSLCSSGVAENIRDFVLTESSIRTQLSRHHHHIACPSHTEGCGAAGDAVYERRYQRMMLGHALHPSVGRALFLEHGCEKTHNDYFRHVLIESGALENDASSELVASIFDFWSLQADGGFDNAQQHIVEYFGRTSTSSSSSIQTTPRIAKPQLFGVPWSVRPISVGLLMDPVLATVADSRLVAPALAKVVRFLSQLHVHSVVPVNSPLISPHSYYSSKQATRTGGNQIVRPSVNVDMEDYFTPPLQSKKEKETLPTSKTMSTDEPVDGKQQISPLCTLFAEETLLDATVPEPTLLPGQMVNQRRRDNEQRGGLHVMELPKCITWDETVSCLSPACDVLLLVASPDQMALLPGSCLSPTLRRAAPSADGEAAQLAWQQWTEDTCHELLKILRSPLVVGGNVDESDAEMIESLQKTLFSLTTFVVPRGHAVSF